MTRTEHYRTVRERLQIKCNCVGDYRCGNCRAADSLAALAEMDAQLLYDLEEAQTGQRLAAADGRKYATALTEANSQLAVHETLYKRSRGKQ